jgi:hypothetical protein
VVEVSSTYGGGWTEEDGALLGGGGGGGHTVDLVMDDFPSGPLPQFWELGFRWVSLAYRLGSVRCALVPVSVVSQHQEDLNGVIFFFSFPFPFLPLSQ